MLSPFLVIGLGGSGGKTLQTIRDDLTRMLQRSQWQGPLPQAWQLLQIDTPATPGEQDPELPAPLTGDSYLGLTSVDVGFDAIDQTLEMRLRGNALARQATAGWRPRAQRVGVPVHRGAGQYRAIGRILTVTYVQRIKEAIEQAIARMHGLSADSELRNAAEALGQTPEGEIGAPTVIIVASIAGGTGSGMLIDVADIVRLVGAKWTSDSFGILFTPEVFNELPPASRQGVRPNAFAALSEILAGFWDRDGFGDDESALLQMAGVNTMGTTRIGVRYPFLIGQSNGRVRFGSQNDVYRASGRALSAWITSEKLQSTMSNYLAGNWTSSAGAADNIPFKEQSRAETQEAPFQAMGFGRVSLGRDRFGQYSSELLARRTVSRLLEGHMEGVPANDRRSPDRILSEAIELEWENFLARSGLDFGREILGQSGSKRVIDSLRSEDLPRKHVQELTSSIQRQLDQDARGATLTLTQIEAHVLDQLRSTGVSARWAYQAAAESEVQAWIVQAQENLLRLSLATAANQGLPVTIGLLQRLSDHMTTSRAAVTGIADARRRISIAAGPRNDQILPIDADEVKALIRNHARQTIAHVDADVLEKISRLTDDLKVNLIDSLIQNLRGILEVARAEATSTRFGEMPQYATWPNGREVPRRLLPTQNERLLLAPDEFYSTLVQILTRQLNAAAEEESIDRAIQEVVLYALDGPDSASVVQQLWVPVDTSFRPANDLGEKSGRTAKISLGLSLTPAKILGRAEQWLSRPDTLVGAFVQESLTQYFDERTIGDREELDRRARRFGRELEEAVKASAPLVAINASVAAVVHPDMSVSPTRNFNGFPFSLDSRAGRESDAVLEALGMDRADRERLFGIDHGEPHVDVFSTLAGPMEAPVFDSLMKPLAEEWDKARAAGPGAVARFWRFRRTRPLPQFIPMSPFVRQAMVRGWFTANLLGQIKTDGAYGPIEIYAPGPLGRAGRYSAFPHPLLLPEGYGNADRIAGILKTAMAALLAVNTSGSLEPLAAYQRLLTLGTTRTGLIQEYDVANGELSDWALTGTLANGAPLPPKNWAGTAQGSLDERREALVQRLNGWETNYETMVFEPVEHLEDLTDVPRAWELRRDYRGALHDLAWALGRLTAHEDDDTV